MSAEWTVERLDALPEFTIIEYCIAGSELDDLDAAVKLPGGRFRHWWGLYSGDPMDSNDILVAGVARSIHVVSVPIDALLADETVGRGYAAFMDESGHPSGRFSRGMEAAVAHVTGETP